MKKIIGLLILTFICSLWFMPAHVEPPDATAGFIMRAVGTVGDGCTECVNDYGEQSVWNTGSGQVPDQYRLYCTRYQFTDEGSDCCIDQLNFGLYDAGTGSIRGGIYADDGDGDNPAPTGSPLVDSTPTATTAGDGNPEAPVTVALDTEWTGTNTSFYWQCLSHNTTDPEFYKAQEADPGSIGVGMGYHDWSPGTWATDDFPTISSFTQWTKSPESYGDHS